MENDKQKVFKLPQVKADTIIDIQVSGTFLKKCQTLLIAVSEKAGEDKIAEVLKKFKETNNIPEDIQEATIFLLVSLVGEIENQALKQNKVEYQEFNEQDLSKLYNQKA